MTDELLARLRAAAPELNLAAVEEEYKDPFWWDRYGERGRRFALEDGGHHFGYVAEAVAGGSPQLLARYARWLRGVLVARGMCSENLADGFRIRRRLLERQGWPGVGPALAAFAVAEDALRYTEGPAAGLVPDPADPPRCGDVAATFGLPPDEVDHEARALLSYLADALALDNPQILLEHLAWREGFDARRGRPAGYRRALLRSLASAVDPASPAAGLLTRAQEPR